MPRDESGKMKRRVVFVLVLVMSILGSAEAEDPVLFSDSYVEEAVEALLGPDPTPTRMLDLTSLEVSGLNVLSLGGLEYALNLVYLDVSSNWISDISPISGLVKLKWLYLQDNLIDDASGLSGLTNLELLSLDDNNIANISALGSLDNLITLWLYNNQVSDISSLAGLTKLNELDLGENQVSDVSPLALLTALEYLWLDHNQVGDIFSLVQLVNLIELDLWSNHISDISSLGLFTKLDMLGLDGNPLNTAAYCRYLPLIEMANPLTIDYLYDPDPNPFAADCSTDMTDLAQWSAHWLDSGCGIENNWCSGADLDDVGDVGLPDFDEFARLWLVGP